MNYGMNRSSNDSTIIVFLMIFLIIDSILLIGYIALFTELLITNYNEYFYLLWFITPKPQNPLKLNQYEDDNECRWIEWLVWLVKSKNKELSVTTWSECFKLIRIIFGYIKGSSCNSCKHSDKMWSWFYIF